MGETSPSLGILACLDLIFSKYAGERGERLFMSVMSCAQVSIPMAVLLAMSTVAVASDDAACRKQAASDYSAGVQWCEQNQRGLSTRLVQCKREAKLRFDRARAICDARARKAGGGQRDWIPATPPPPKDPKPK
jgi:hypothetical protein